MIKLLVDECLHTSLPGVAHEAGYLCDHVNFLGLAGCADWQLMDTILTSEYTFVTNNGADFRRLYSREALHSGLIILLPNTVPAQQQVLLRAALSYVGMRDLTNTVVQVDFDGREAVCIDFEFPPVL